MGSVGVGLHGSELRAPHLQCGPQATVYPWHIPCVAGGRAAAGGTISGAGLWAQRPSADACWPQESTAPVVRPNCAETPTAFHGLPPGRSGLGTPDAAVRVRSVRDLDGALEWAAELGLHGPVGAEDMAVSCWLGMPSDAERELSAALLGDAEARVYKANDTTSWLARLKTMLHWLQLFEEALPNYVLFRPLHGSDHHRNARHNEDSLARLEAFMRRHGSIKPGQLGKPISSDQVLAVISTLRAFRAIGARYSLLTPECNEWLPRIRKQMRREDGPSIERKLQLGLRAQHFERLDEVGWDRRSAAGIFDHALAHTLKIVVGRGGEAALREGAPQTAWDPERGPTIADFNNWFPAREGVNEGLPWVRVWWYPIKDTQGTHKKSPTPVSKRGHAAPGSDPACPYDAIRIWFEIRSAQVPQAQWAEVAFFCHPTTGKMPDTKYVRELARRMGQALGIPPAALGGKSFRIAGATDLYDVYGEHARRLLHERGRWATDIAYIYARVSESAHLAAARRMASASGVDFGHSAGWSQPA